jgi:serine/threonine-protein kinase
MDGILATTFQLLIVCVGLSLVTAAIYLALEPHVRKRAPELLVGWTRLLEGRTRDPRVGRDLLIGAAIGVGVFAFAQVAWAVATSLSAPGSATRVSQFTPDGLAADLFGIPPFAIFNILGFLGGYIVFLGLLRRKAAAGTAIVMLSTVSAIGDPSVGGIVAGAVFGFVMAIVIVRLGLLASFGAVVAYMLLERMPLPLDPGSAYWTQSLIPLLLLLALVFYAMRVAVGSRALFRFGLEE